MSNGTPVMNSHGSHAQPMTPEIETAIETLRVQADKWRRDATQCQGTPESRHANTYALALEDAIRTLRRVGRAK